MFFEKLKKRGRNILSPQMTVLHTLKFQYLYLYIFSLSIAFMNNLEMTIKRIGSICPRKRKFMANYAVS